MDRRGNFNQIANSTIDEHKFGVRPNNNSNTNGFSNGLEGDSKPKYQKRTSLPTISVNDKPVRNRQTSLSGYNPGNAADKHHRAHLGPDLTSSTTGMFSECMFESPPQKNGAGSPSPASLYTKPDLIDLEYSRRTTSQSSSSHRHRRHHSQNPGYSGWRTSNASYNHSKRHPARSYSSTFAPDGKRLVNQFLRSVEPFTSNDENQTNESIADNENHDSTNLDCKSSLQALLYRDLEQLPRSMVKPPPITIPGAPRSSPTGSASSTSVFQEENPSSSASSYGVSDESYIPPEFDMDNMVYNVNNQLWLNYHEQDYWKRHIASQLQNFEQVLKQNLREVVIKDEFEFQKNLKSFDSLVNDLKKMRQRVLQMYESIKNKSLVSLRREFDEKAEDTFMSRTNATVGANVEQLESLENRIEVSKRKLIRQRDTLKKMENLLSLKDNMLASKKNARLTYQYRYMVFDLGIFTSLICICALIKWLL